MLTLALPIAALVLVLLSTPYTYAAPKQSTGERHIVVFEDGVSDADRRTVLGKVRGVHQKRLSKAANADVVSGLSTEDLAQLTNDPKVKRVDPDVVVTITQKGGQGSAQATQPLPWNIDRIDAEKVWPIGNTAMSVKVAVLDTGISLSHPDLSNNVKGSVNTINGRRSANDDNGHGSHVAGIIGALNNSVGVVGAAPQVSLYAVKVLDANGSGYLSDIIEGLDWSIANRMQVVNMSLGTTADVQSFRDAVVRAYQAGIVLVGAAGNNGGSVNYPARYPEVIAVAATDTYDTVPSWSSRGSEVALAAPGVSVYSTYKGKNYATLSGTSMAAPHVAAAAALLLKVPSACDTDLSGTCSPAEVLARLTATAEDKGVLGVDTLYGYGIVNAYAAITQ